MAGDAIVNEAQVELLIAERKALIHWLNKCPCMCAACDKLRSVLEQIRKSEEQNANR